MLMRPFTIGDAVSAAALLALFAGAVLLGRRIARRRGSPRAVTIGIVTAVVLLIASQVLNTAVDIDHRFGVPSVWPWVIVLAEFAGAVAIAAFVAYLSSPQAQRRASAVASVVPVILLILIVNPITELILLCLFGRALYATQFFAGATCG